MARKSKISWTDDTFNPWMGCSKVSEACHRCYAERQMDHRWNRVQWGPGQPRVRTQESNWNEVLKWNRTPFYEATINGQIVRGEQKDITRFHRELGAIHTEIHETRRRVFSASLADIFDAEVDPAWRVDYFALVKQCPNIDWLILTKRPELIGDMMVTATGIPMDEVLNGPQGWNFKKHLPQVCLGVTGETQKWLVKRTPELFRHPASLHWLSAEPLLGPLDFVFEPYESVKVYWNALSGSSMGVAGLGEIGAHYGWVIVGGESGDPADAANLAVLNPDHVRSIRDDCAHNRVPFHFKQWGNVLSTEPGVWHPKTKTGHLLDGVEHFNYYESIQ